VTEPGPAESGSDTFEFTIAGGLGPVLRAALQPVHAAPTARRTVLTTTCSVDLVDLVWVLTTLGLQVDDVRVLRPGDVRPQ
jgi:hypothetical protein